ncbi:hypothetical protein PanWU01x14_282000 [Parasponia andersonii]|uniref:Transmembrane protein n=1 Tax=Parasponia andersonii TaxID=3476 RepID=A0A2P5B0X9_PARAD|nr:hypothetical protein PanWU01x14_282000 [Parasponia andersonii]
MESPSAGDHDLAIYMDDTQHPDSSNDAVLDHLIPPPPPPPPSDRDVCLLFQLILGFVCAFGILISLALLIFLIIFGS